MLNFSDYSLRPLTIDDKEMIYLWRNSERVRTNMYNDQEISLVEHNDWFHKALLEKNARYFIFEYVKKPVGFVSFTGISEKHDRCSWAFYMGDINVPKGSGSAMEYFALDFVFCDLKIRKLCCEVFIFNSGVIKLHEKFGFAHEGRFIQHHKRNDIFEDVVSLAKFQESWQEDKKNLYERCFGKVD